MAYERVQKPTWQPQTQNKHSQIFHLQTEAESLPSPKLAVSGLPSKKEREAIKRSIFGNAIQMYSEGENELAKARISQNQKIVLKSPRELYATQDKIDNINRDLAEGKGIYLKAQKEDKIELNGQTLYGVKPVLNQTSEVAENKKQQVVALINSNRLTPHTAETLVKGLSPNNFDQEDDRNKKDDLYKKFLDNSKKLLNTFIDSFKKTKVYKNYKSLITSRSGGNLQSEVEDVDLKELRNLVANFKQQQPFVGQLVTPAELELQAQKATYVNILNFDAKLIEASKKIEQEKNSREDTLILPTDCSSISSIVAPEKKLSGKENQLDPEVGQTHFVDFNNDPEFKDLDVGWNFHWGGVIMKDGSTTVTLENAADAKKVRMPIDRTSWYFGMYGADNTDKSFSAEYRRKNREYMQNN